MLSKAGVEATIPRSAVVMSVCLCYLRNIEITICLVSSCTFKFELGGEVHILKVAQEDYRERKSERGREGMNE